MAFHYAADAIEKVEKIGHVLPMAKGSVALTGGTATVTIPFMRLVHMAVASSQTSNAARVSAVSGNTFTITGTGTDRVDWVAYGHPEA